MARRRELKSIASGLAWYCVSRNNDIFGYWGVGVIYRLAMDGGIETISLSMDAALSGCPELQFFKKCFLDRACVASHDLSCFVEGFEVEFRFDPYSLSEVRGCCARVMCRVHIIDDLGKRRSASSVTFCYPHDPRFEVRSNR